MMFLAAVGLQTLPPGPPLLPLPPVFSDNMGSLPLIGLGKAVGIGPPPHVRMSQLADNYGDVMTLQMGREPWVVLSSPDAVHEAFIVKGQDFSGRPMVPSMKVSSGGGQGFAKPELDSELIRLRKTAFGQLFDARSVKNAQEQFEAETQLLVEHLLATTRQKQTSNGGNGGGAEIRPALRRAVTNMVLRYAFSERVPYATEESTTTRSSSTKTSSIFEELVDVVENIWKELTSTQTFLTDLVVQPNLADVYYATGASPIRSLVRKRDSILRTIISRRKRQRKNQKLSGNTISDKEIDMLDVLLNASLPDSDVLYTLVDLFVAGVNTVSTTLEWMLLITAKHPQYQIRARKDATISTVDHVNGQHGHKKKQTNKTPLYVDALIKETLRAKPPLLLPRRSVVDTSIGNYRIPAGRVVLANNWSLTHNSRWWNDPKSFRPERWLEEERRTFKGIETCKFIPYSIGRRACPGSRLAEAEISTAIIGLLGSVSWSRVDPIILNEEYSLTLSPQKSQSLRFHRLK